MKTNASAATFSQKLDDFGRRHPRLMLLVVLAVTMLLTVPALLYNSQGGVVLYQAF